MLTKEQKQNMKERLEKALELLKLHNFCDGIICEDCPFGPSCLRVKAIVMLTQAINRMEKE